MSDRHIAVHCTEHVGMTVGDCTLTQHENVNGTFYWKATQQITHLFGSEVDAAPLVGIGRTQEIAIQRLQQKRKEFQESLWA